MYCCSESGGKLEGVDVDGVYSALVPGDQHLRSTYVLTRQMPDQGRIDNIMNDLLNDDVYLDFHIPFELNVEAASSQLARWLSDDEAASAFSVVGVFSCSTNTNLLQNALDPSLGRDLRLFVHLTTHLYTTGMQGGYQQYTDQEIRHDY
jgi:hypothetical protein